MVFHYPPMKCCSVLFAFSLFSFSLFKYKSLPNKTPTLVFRKQRRTWTTWNLWSTEQCSGGPFTSSAHALDLFLHYSAFPSGASQFGKLYGCHWILLWISVAPKNPSFLAWLNSFQRECLQRTPFYAICSFWNVEKVQWTFTFPFSMACPPMQLRAKVLFDPFYLLSQYNFLPRPCW